MKRFSVIATALVLFEMGVARAQVDHGHLNIGAAGRNQGDKLTWDNGGDFAESSGYVKTLFLNTNTTAKYLGFYDGNITLTALHNTNAFGEIIAGGPATGSLIDAQIVSVVGPAGGAFGFW